MVLMNEPLGYAHFKINDMAEGTQASGEFAEPASPLNAALVSIVHNEPGVKGVSAEERMMSQIGVEFESGDNCDAQDAPQTMEGHEPAFHAQTAVKSKKSQ